MGCTWYTFNLDENLCIVMLTCTEVNVDTCGNCVSGKVEMDINMQVKLSLISKCEQFHQKNLNRCR